MGLLSQYSATPLTTPMMEGFPWDDLRKILPGYQRVTKVPNGVETLPISIA